MLRGRLLVFMLMATAANADVFSIAFNPVADVFPFGGGPQPLFFTGIIVTDGVCSLCTIHQSLGSVTSDGIISIELNPGLVASPFALGTPSSLGVYAGDVSFDVKGGILGGLMVPFGADQTIEFGDTITSCIYNEPCLKEPNAYDFGAEGLAAEWGTYTISRVPEPSSWLTLAAITVPMVLRRRRVGVRRVRLFNPPPALLADVCGRGDIGGSMPSNVGRLRNFFGLRVWRDREIRRRRFKRSKTCMHPAPPTRTALTPTITSSNAVQNATKYARVATSWLLASCGARGGRRGDSLARARR
jgi:hypothetical protein